MWGDDEAVWYGSERHGQDEGMYFKIRFHGRGGHGVKTAARIVGTAAFRAGYHAQDSPMYGAERRGAPVSSSVRISDRPILERGPIPVPDLIVLADETLLRDSYADVLRGQEGASAVVINRQEVAANQRMPVERRAEFEIQPDVISVDLSGLTRQVLGRASALSAGLAGAAIRSSGLISLDILRQAVRDELEALDVPAAEVEKNVAVGEQVFNILRPVPFEAKSSDESQELVEIPYQLPLQAAPSILHTGNSTLRQTGGWRVERPVVDRAACTRCGLCFVMCPDGAIEMDAGGYPVIDYDHCKGCMICQRLCPLRAIGRQLETQAW
jgi:pyruvate ferredoxin oxidoreductase gamma subunit